MSLRFFLLFMLMVLYTTVSLAETTTGLVHNLGDPAAYMIKSKTNVTKVPKGPIAPPNENVPGKRTKVGAGNLYIPDFYKPEADGITLVLFFHGASWCAEQGFYHARRNAVLVSLTVPDYGYADFIQKDPRNMQELIYGTQGYLKNAGLATGNVKRIVLSAFSGGWIAVDAILRDPAWAPMVTDVLLADALYPHRSGKTEIDPVMIQPIQDFATSASKATTATPTMAYTYLFPPDPKYRENTTNKAAEYLATKIELQWQDTEGTTSRGMQYGRRADAGNLHLIGVKGMTTQDHFEHFYSWEDLLRMSSLPEAPQK